MQWIHVPSNINSICKQISYIFENKPISHSFVIICNANQTQFPPGRFIAFSGWFNGKLDSIKLAKTVALLDKLSIPFYNKDSFIAQQIFSSGITSLQRGISKDMSYSLCRCFVGYVLIWNLLKNNSFRSTILLGYTFQNQYYYKILPHS